MAELDKDSGSYQAAKDEAAAWLNVNWDPLLTVRQWWARLADSGWAFPTWPEKWYGRGLSAEAALGARAAFTEIGALAPPGGLGQMLGGPTLLAHGTEEQMARFLPGLARGEESWCQFFSEPGAGSDLAGAQTRAVRTGGRWVIDGQKVWTSGAQSADRGMLVARTNRDVPKHQGLTYFIIDVDQPGIEVRPLHQMNGARHFNEVFFTGAEVDEDRIVGELNGGWSVAVTTLMFERYMSALPSAAPGRRGGQLDQQAGTAAAEAATHNVPGVGGEADLISDAARELKVTGDPVLRQRLAALWSDEATLGYLARRHQDTAREGRRPGSQGSLTKLAHSQLARTGRDTGMAVLGAHGMLDSERTPGGGEIQFRALSAPGSSIAGGTDEIQRGIVGERVLGLPKEPRMDRDVPFRELTIGTTRQPPGDG